MSTDWMFFLAWEVGHPAVWPIEIMPSRIRVGCDLEVKLQHGDYVQLLSTSHYLSHIQGLVSTIKRSACRSLKDLELGPGPAMLCNYSYREGLHKATTVSITPVFALRSHLPGQCWLKQTPEIPVRHKAKLHRAPCHPPEGLKWK